MYLPAHFREDRRDVQHDLIRRHPLGMLVTAGAGGLLANAVPFLLDAEAGEAGTLHCHVARANPQWKDLAGVDECLVIFQGADHYISPSWYPSKQEAGKVLPTWNYATVHVWRRPREIEDAAWLHAHVQALTDTNEQRRAAPWAVSDAPEPFVAAQLRGIVGVEIPIGRIEGKWKVSQNRSAVDRAGVVDGLAGEGAEAQGMARLVAERMSSTTQS